MRKYASLALPPRTVVLTFDDGPNPHDDVTERLLDVLDVHEATACFCVMGEQVARHPALLRRIADAGHLIVNHSHTHSPVFYLQSAQTMHDEIARCDAAIGTALGIDDYRSRFFRPPSGVVTQQLREILQQRELEVMPVTFVPMDVFHSPATAPVALKQLLHSIRRDAGALPVIHDRLAVGGFSTGRLASHQYSHINRAWVPNVVDALIDTLTPEGYRFTHAPLTDRG